MNVRQAIQASANVVRITEITAGDVYKRFERDDCVLYGVVLAVHNDGENAIVEAIEYEKSYFGLDVKTKILKGNNSLAIFLSTPDELNFELDGIANKKKSEIEEKRDEIAKLEREIDEIAKLESGETLKGLKAMSYQELTQNQFNQKKLEAGL